MTSAWWKSVEQPHAAVDQGSGRPDPLPAEGRGGYPGGKAPGWPDYVLEQRRYLAAYRAVAGRFGDTNESRRGYFKAVDDEFTPDVRLLGEENEPHVDDVAGRLLYSLPVDSGPVGTVFSFPIRQSDLDVLLSDPYRRAVLETVAHAVLRRSMARGAQTVTEMAFSTLVSSTLHSTADELRRFVAAVDREHTMVTNVFVELSLARRAADPARTSIPPMMDTEPPPSWRSEPRPSAWGGRCLSGEVNPR